MNPAPQGWVILKRKKVGDFHPQNDIVGRGPTEFDYGNLGVIDGPVFFINDAVQFDWHCKGASYFFAVDKPMVNLLVQERKALPVVPRDMERAIQFAKTEFEPEILFYENDLTPRERLLRFSREELANLGELYNGSATILSALHFIWFCGCECVNLVGCDGINDPHTLFRLGHVDDGYDRRMENLSQTQPLWKYSKIREEQERISRQLDLNLNYVGTPKHLHPNRFHHPNPQIPQIAHFIWLGGKLPSFVRSNISRFEELHRSWDIRVWDSLPAALPDEFRSLILKLPQLCMRSDVLRIWVLHQFGGIYLDGDIYPVRAFDELRHFEHFFASENDGAVATNCVVGAQAKSAFTGELIDHLRAASRRPEIPTVRTAFGPTLFTQLASSYGELLNPLPCHYFCPIENHQIAFALTHQPFQTIHATLVASEEDWSDPVWPYGIHTYGIPPENGPSSSRSSWAVSNPLGDAILRRVPNSHQRCVHIGKQNDLLVEYLAGHHPDMAFQDESMNADPNSLNYVFLESETSSSDTKTWINALKPDGWVGGIGNSDTKDSIVRSAGGLGLRTRVEIDENSTWFVRVLGR